MVARFGAEAKLMLGLLISITLMEVTTAPAVAPATPSVRAAERGRNSLLGKSYNPPVAPLAYYENAWKNWGLEAKPREYEKLFRERYGLHEAPYPNGGMPMGLRVEPMGLGLGKGLTSDCLLCHGGSVFGKSYVGLGNTALDIQTYYEEVMGGPRKTPPPFPFSQVRGTSEAGGMAVFLLGYRESDLSLRLTRKDLDLQYDLCEDVPAWWLFYKKKTMYHTGGMDTRSTRSLMQFMMSPLNFPSAFHKSEADFKDIREFLASLRAPKYPLAVDAKKAARGQVVFKDNCARCHGTYGEKWTYPNKIISLKDIGTDPRRYEGITKKFAEAYDQSWFGKDYKTNYTDGYQAPPLDGIWATAPYLHNGSVPTLYHLLNSKTRPRIFTRSYRTDREAYDEKLGGWKISVLESGPDPRKATGMELRRVYDTTKSGRGNGGHLYGDKLTEEERMEVIEYLKTL